MTTLTVDPQLLQGPVLLLLDVTTLSVELQLLKGPLVLLDLITLTVDPQLLKGPLSSALVSDHTHCGPTTSQRPTLLL